MKATCRRMGVDETAFRKRHDYITVVIGQEKGYVIHVADDRREKSLVSFYDRLTDKQEKAIECVSMDMWQTFIGVILESIPGAENKIAFDKFPIVKYLGDAVGKVRRQEHKALLKTGSDILKGSKYVWQTNPETMSTKRWRDFKELRNSTLKTARAWALKEFGPCLWHASAALGPKRTEVADIVGRYVAV